tara:strand:- start:18 stop:197 length:180 start_codon:yes stop_codon:yes gene_type:complete
VGCGLAERDLYLSYEDVAITIRFERFEKVNRLEEIMERKKSPIIGYNSRDESSLRKIRG